jgi:hypothetical protein
MGGNLVNYPNNCGTPTTDLFTVKLMFSSIISTPNAKFMTINIKDYYLMTPMDHYKYFRIKLEFFPQDIINGYGLHDKVDADGNVFCEVQRGMYGLPQAGILAQDLLTKHLYKAGYRQSKITPGYWRHDWCPISFTLVVDDFGVKYTNKDDVQHLVSVLKKDYEIDIDWEGTRYLGLMLDWDYAAHKVHLSMPGYIEKARVQFGHVYPTKPQMQPHPHTVPTYGATIQYAKAIDSSPAATKEEEKYIGQVIGVLLYYGQAADSTILVGLSSLATAQAEPTAHTVFLVKWLLDYAVTNLDAILTYKKSNMVIAVHSNASYLSKPLARSLVGGYFSACPTLMINPTTAPSSISPKFSRQSCPVQPKPNSAPCTSTPVKQSPCNTSLKRWATSNLPHPSKPTTAQHMVLSPTTSKLAAPKQWT